MQDVFQDCLVKVMTKIGSFEYRGPGSLLAWAKRIVVNRSLDFLKSCKRHEFTRLDRDIEDEAEEDDPPIRDIPPEVIHRMVSELPTGYRTVFNLYVFEDRSHKEIAQLLGIKPDSSASQLCKAKNMLARKIKEYYGQTGQGR